MSVARTLSLAHLARAKLSTEANRSDHDLRLLVGHANLLDSLMVELADAGREQETWFNQSLSGAAAGQHDAGAAVDDDDDTTDSDDDDDWAVESESESEPDPEQEEDDDGDDEHDEEEEYKEDVDMAGAASARKTTSRQPAKLTRHRRRPLVAARPALLRRERSVAVDDSSYYDDDDYCMAEDDDDELSPDLRLARVSSHPLSPPELDHDADTSEDEAMPLSPAAAADVIPLPDTTKPDRDEDEPEEDHHYDSFYSEGYYLPPMRPTRLAPTFAAY